MKSRSVLKKSFVAVLACGLTASLVAQAYGESTVIQNYLNRQTPLPMIKPSWGNFIIHTNTLKQLYSLRSYEALWVDGEGRPNANSLVLKAYLQNADRHGLSSGDYWDAEVEGLYTATQSNQKNWITFELAATEALIRYVTHLSVGRVDPESIDDDIKFKQKKFTNYPDLMEALNVEGDKMGAQLDRFAPTHPRYRDLVAALGQLRTLKTQGGWAPLASAGVVIKLGVTAPLVEQIRARFNQLGYAVTATGAVADAEFIKVLKEFQANNGLSPDGVMGVSSEVLRVLNYSVEQRISQIEVNMEKLRWLPREIEDRHIFVNLATAEFNLFDGTKKVFDFKTINGQAFRRTPSMRDVLYRIILNPTWTVPNSISMRDKVPAMQRDPAYLQKHNMKLMDARTDMEVDPSTIDWNNANTRNFAYYIRQNPGYDNALGVMKFDLRLNPWAIYLHDTNERHLFAQSARHRSSGCIRVERPMDLAEYLVQGLPDWNRARLTAAVPSRVESAPRTPFALDLQNNAIPVYILYLTVEKSAAGGLRFIDDVYGQDLRISKALQNRKASSELF